MFTSIGDTCNSYYEATICLNDQYFMDSDIRHTRKVWDRYCIIGVYALPDAIMDTYTGCTYC